MFIYRKMKLFWVMLTSKAKALDSKISVILESKASALGFLHELGEYHVSC